MSGWTDAPDPEWYLTPEGLAATMDLIPGKEPPDINEEIRAGLISRQVGIASFPHKTCSSSSAACNKSQRRSECQDTGNEYSAKYLPQTIEKWKANDDVMSAATNLINEISAMPYFMRLATHPDNQDFVVLQFKRTLAAADAMDRAPAVEVAMNLQFLSTLLVVQGASGIPEEDKAALIPRLRAWKRKFPGVLAGETAERCLAVLTGQGYLAPMIPMARGHMLKGVQTCAAEGCSRDSGSDGGPLQRCAKCKSTVYCSQQHQKSNWSQHKPRCFKVEY
ncbi:hypothetical protein HDZ31DRAFT_33626 [Schizophyllum fasciatum]